MPDLVGGDDAGRRGLWADLVDLVRIQSLFARVSPQPHGALPRGNAVLPPLPPLPPLLLLLLLPSQR